jgi:lipopolysaccharide heptosyltransferase I
MPNLYTVGVSKVNRILIVKLSSFGDVVQTLPLLHVIRASFPNATIGWAVQKSFAPLIDGHPMIDKVHVLPSKKLAPCLALGEELRETRYDIVLDAQGLFVSGLVSYLSKAPRRIGYNWRREANQIFMTDASVIATDRVHMVEKILRLGDAIGATRLPFIKDDYLAAKPLPSQMIDDSRNYASLVVGASVSAKTLSPDHWARLAQKLSVQGLMPILIGGPQERAVAESIEQCAGCQVVNLAGKTSFSELAGVLAYSSVVVSSDTGALHLAVAVGTPSVGLCGVTDPVRTGNSWGQAPSIILDAGGSAEGRNFRDVAPDAKVVDTLETNTIIEASLKIARCTQ